MGKYRKMRRITSINRLGRESVKSLLKSHGEDINSISKQEFARRYHIHPWTVGEAFKEMEQIDQL